MLKDKTVKVEQATDELLQGVRQFLKDTKKTVDDGWQPGQDVPAIIMAAYSDLFSKVQNIGKLSGELAENKVAFAKTWALGAFDIAEDFLV